MVRRSDSVGDFEKALDVRRRGPVVLRLYVAGGTASSMRAVENLRAICKDHLPEHQLEVIDIYRRPHALRRDQIIAVPTLVKVAPLPVRRVVGDLSNLERVLGSLNVQPKAHQNAPQKRKNSR